MYSEYSAIENETTYKFSSTKQLFNDYKICKDYKGNDGSTNGGGSGGGGGGGGNGGGSN